MRLGIRRGKRSAPQQPGTTPPRLSVELVPIGQWGANLSQALKGPRWDYLRRTVYEQAGYRCEVCGGKGSEHPVEAHEVWEYDEATGVQRLVRMIALCPACHEVKHIGKASRVGHGEAALDHLQAVNGWTEAQTREYIDDVFAVWDRRNRIAWKLDLAALADYDVVPPTEAALAASAEAAQRAYANPAEYDGHHSNDPDSGGVSIRAVSVEEALALLDQEPTRRGAA